MSEELVKVNNNEIVNFYSKFVGLDFPASETQSASSIKKYIKQGVAMMFLYKVDNNIVGWAFLTKDNARNIVYLHYLAVFSKYRNLGYGSNILTAIKNQLKVYNYIYLDVEAVENKDKTQQRRHNFYMKNGFVKTELETVGWGVRYNYFYAPLKTNKYTCNEIFDSLIQTYLIKDEETYLKKNFKRIK